MSEMKWQIADRLLAEEIVTHSQLTFLARDLGFPDYTAIHDVVKPILARHIAPIVNSYIAGGRAKLVRPKGDE